MSTHALIRVEGIDYCKLYKHFDGNPENTLQWLKDFNEDFSIHNKNNSQYKMAQLIRSSIVYADKYNLGISKYYDWGVVNYDCDCGANHTYLLKENGDVIHKYIIRNYEEGV